MIRDDVAVNNERVKLFAGFLNALGLALIGLGALAPVVAVLSQPAGAATPVTLDPAILVISAALGLALHVGAHYVLMRMRKAKPDDPG